MLPYAKRLDPGENGEIFARIARVYDDGASIRAIAAKTGRSYGFIHRLLAERPDVTFRERGGANRNRTT
ncbi:helix-turn-helix domain-containing protein [Streptomyces sp. NPDC002454]